MWTMDSIGIEAFLAVIRHGSLTDAANALFISQSTLSHRLAKLESDVGVNLIERGRGIRSLSLTADGQEFLLLAKRWEGLLLETTQIRSRKKSISLSIGAVDSINSYVLPPVYRALSELSRDLEISIRTQQSTELYLLLERGEIDIAFGLIEQPMPGMIIDKFLAEPLVVIRREETPQTHEMIDILELDPDKELYMNWHASFHAWYNKYRSATKYPPIRVDTSILLHTFMETPGYWAIVPLSMAENFKATGKYGLYRLKNPPPDRICYQIQSIYPRPSAVEGLKILDSVIKKVLN